MCFCSTVVSLRERLNQKEETLGRFEKLLKQSRSEYDTSLRQRQDEIIALKSTVRNQNQTIHDLKSQSSYKNIEVMLISCNNSLYTNNSRKKLQ